MWRLASSRRSARSYTRRALLMSVLCAKLRITFHEQHACNRVTNAVQDPAQPHPSCEWCKTHGQSRTHFQVLFLAQHQHSCHEVALEDLRNFLHDACEDLVATTHPAQSTTPTFNLTRPKWTPSSLSFACAAVRYSFVWMQGVAWNSGGSARGRCLATALIHASPRPLRSPFGKLPFRAQLWGCYPPPWWWPVLLLSVVYEFCAGCTANVWLGMGPRASLWAQARMWQWSGVSTTWNKYQQRIDVATFSTHRAIAPNRPIPLALHLSFLYLFRLQVALARGEVAAHRRWRPKIEPSILSRRIFTRWTTCALIWLPCHIS